MTKEERDTLYPMTLYFSRRWLSGPLKGTVTHETASGDDPAALYRAFHTGATGRAAITKHRYEVVDASFQNYRR